MLSLLDESAVHHKFWCGTSDRYSSKGMTTRGVNDFGSRLDTCSPNSGQRSPRDCLPLVGDPDPCSSYDSDLSLNLATPPSFGPRRV